jgi:hypothetical protein
MTIARPAPASHFALLAPVVLAVLLLAAGAGAEEPLWLAVGPAPLVEAIAPLAKHRAAQGLRTVVRPGTVEDALKDHRPDFLLLVGDSAAGAEAESWYLAAPRAKLYRWRSVQSEDFAADVLYGDRDGDELPECAVGRIPARTPDEVAAVVRKILAFETRAPAAEDLRLPVWAGAPGYGGFVDAMATSMLVTTVRGNAPRWTGPWIVSANLDQPLCGWPPDHPSYFAASMRRGAILGALLAHATPTRRSR